MEEQGSFTAASVRVFPSSLVRGPERQMEEMSEQDRTKGDGTSRTRDWIALRVRLRQWKCPSALNACSETS